MSYADEGWDEDEQRFFAMVDDLAAAGALPTGLPLMTSKQMVALVTDLTRSSFVADRIFAGTR